jgi:hypothetical protein
MTYKDIIEFMDNRNGFVKITENVYARATDEHVAIIYNVLPFANDPNTFGLKVFRIFKKCGLDGKNDVRGDAINSKNVTIVDGQLSFIETRKI